MKGHAKNSSVSGSQAVKFKAFDRVSKRCRDVTVHIPDDIFVDYLEFDEKTYTPYPSFRRFPPICHKGLVSTARLRFTKNGNIQLIILDRVFPVKKGDQGEYMVVDNQKIEVSDVEKENQRDADRNVKRYERELSKYKEGGSKTYMLTSDFLINQNTNTSSLLQIQNMDGDDAD